MKMQAKYVSEWDCDTFETECTLCTETGKITNIETVEADHVNVLEKEYVLVETSSTPLRLSIEDEQLTNEALKALQEHLEKAKNEPFSSGTYRNLETGELLTPDEVLKTVTSSKEILSNIKQAAEASPELPWGVADIEVDIRETLNIELDTDDTDLFKELLSFYNGRQTEFVAQKD